MDQSEIDAILNNIGDDEESNKKPEQNDSIETAEEKIDTNTDSEVIDENELEQQIIEEKDSEEYILDNEDKIKTEILNTLNSETTFPIDEEGHHSISLEDIKVKIIGALVSLTDLKKLLVDLDILNKISELSEALAKGEVNEEIDIKVKGALGNLVDNLRQTMLKLQQLDTSVKEESSKVPALAEQLDAITKDTEKATQIMLTKIDEVLANSDSSTAGLENLEDILSTIIEEKKENNIMVSSIIDLLDSDATDEQLAGSALEYVMYLKETDSHNRNIKMLEELKDSLDKVKKSQTVLQNDAFDIMNELQFQDITRQKIEKVIQLLKDLQLGLKHLLEIFHMNVDDDFSIIDDGKIAHTTQNNIFSVKTDADYKKADVDDIINSFKQNNENGNE